ncbi:MAG: fibronectin type III domain-containing protein [Ruminococcus sp.]|nr:fibronectin type III domain-containing protein [Ruminococcus sp.]MBQ1432981.1 fibronectin type III domain-containing protein [Ruminococcus sp.]
MSLNKVRIPATLKKMAVLLASLLAMLALTFIGGIKASAATVSGSAAVPSMNKEKTYESSYTHPYNKQIDTIVLHWNKTKNANRYQVYIKGGKYKSWSNYCTTTNNTVSVKKLDRATTYKFKVRAIYPGNTYSRFSAEQSIMTARMNYDKAGWEAMCRIVYHEVGRINDSMWDKPIVYVSDCVANRFVAAKYENDPLWAPFYKNYYNIQSIIYTSGGFMSDYGLSRDGCNYYNVPDKVKKAVWGAVYGDNCYKGIKNDYDVYYWCNRSYYTSSSKIAYSFRIPWGYFSIWRSYWG